MKVPEIPDNSLKTKIKQLINACKIAAEDFGEDAFEFNDHASDSDIENWEKENGICIPDSYKEWLRFSGSATICDNVAVFYGLNEFVTDNDEKSYDVPTDCIVIGELGGCGCSLCFSGKTGEIMYFDEGEKYVVSDFGEIIDWVITDLI